MLTAAVVDRTAVAVAIDTVTYYYGGRHRRTFTNKTNFVLRVEVILAKCRRRSMYQQNPTPALGDHEKWIGIIIKHVISSHDLNHVTSSSVASTTWVAKPV